MDHWADHKTFDDAPVVYNTESRIAWAEGYNAAVAAFEEAIKVNMREQVKLLRLLTKDD